MQHLGLYAEVAELDAIAWNVAAHVPPLEPAALLLTQL